MQTNPRLSARPLALLAIAISAIGLLAFGAAGSRAATGRYVALGDSNSNGVGLGATDPGSIPNCYRTVNGYPSLVASALGFSDFATAGCSSAAVNDFTTTQDLYPSGVAPPQFDLLNGTETVVSITIGGNDAGFGYVKGNCFQPSPGSTSATPCRDNYGSDGTTLKTYATNMGYGLGVAIDQIHSISPNARVFIVGYPRLIPPNGAGCWGKTNISSLDAPIFDIWQRSIAEVQKSMAEAHDADYVDMYEASAGHDGCQPSGQWTNPDLNANPNDHPTLAGMQAMAQRLITAINTPKASKGGTGANGQTISLVFTARKVRAASAPLAPVVGNAPSKHGAKFSVTLKNAADVDFFVDRAKPGRLKGGKCRSMSSSAGKGRKACTLYVHAASTTKLTLPAGDSTVYFTGRSGAKRLKSGKYRVRAVTSGLSVKTPTFSLSN